MKDASRNGHPKPDWSQHDRFIEAARQIGSDEDDVAFKAKLAAIARAKPQDAPEPSKADDEVV